jgi:hypothetical protein
MFHTEPASITAWCGSIWQDRTGEEKLNEAHFLISATQRKDHNYPTTGQFTNLNQQKGNHKTSYLTANQCLLQYPPPRLEPGNMIPSEEKRSRESRVRADTDIRAQDRTVKALWLNDQPCWKYEWMMIINDYFIFQQKWEDTSSSWLHVDHKLKIFLKTSFVSFYMFGAASFVLC